MHLIERAPFSGKPIMTVDVDEVMRQFVNRLVDWHNELYKTDYVPGDYLTTYSLPDLWRCDAEEANRRITLYYETDDACNVEPVPGAIEALIQLQDHYDLVVVTSTDWKFDATIIRWLDHYIPNVFKQVIFTGFWEKSRLTKGDVAKKLGAVWAIDDMVSNAEDYAVHGVPVIMFGDYFWNRRPLTVDGIQKASNWQEAYAILIK